MSKCVSSITPGSNLHGPRKFKFFLSSSCRSASRADIARFAEFSRADPGQDRGDLCFTEEFGASTSTQCPGVGAGASAGSAARFKAYETRRSPDGPWSNRLRRRLDGSTLEWLLGLRDHLNTLASRVFRRSPLQGLGVKVDGLHDTGASVGDGANLCEPGDHGARGRGEHAADAARGQGQGAGGARVRGT